MCVFLTIICTAPTLLGKSVKFKRKIVHLHNKEHAFYSNCSCGVHILNLPPLDIYIEGEGKTGDLQTELFWRIYSGKRWCDYLLGRFCEDRAGAAVFSKIFRYKGILYRKRSLTHILNTELHLIAVDNPSFELNTKHWKQH
jgi:hypothetical protein